MEAQVLDLDANLATLCILGSLLHLLLLHFLTLVQPFLLLFFLLERECVREMRGEWVELRFRCWKISPICVDMWAMQLNGWQLLSTQSTVSALSLDGPVDVADNLIDSGFVYPSLGTWSLWPWVHVEAFNGLVHPFSVHKCLELGPSIGVLLWRLPSWPSCLVVNSVRRRVVGC